MQADRILGLGSGGELGPEPVTLHASRCDERLGLLLGQSPLDQGFRRPVKLALCRG